MSQSKLSTSSVKCLCGSKDIILVELWQDHTITWEQIDGFFDKNDGNQEVGHPVKVEAKCKKCGKRWTVRKAYQIDDVIINNNEQ